MAWVDLLILIAAGWGIFKGIRTGAVQQVVGIGGFFLSLIVAAALMNTVGAMLVQSFGISPRISPLAGFGVVMVGMLLLVGIATRALEKMFEAVKLGFVNRAAGGGIGMLRGLLVVSGLLLPLRAINVPSRDVRDASPFYAPVAGLMPWVWDHSGGLVREGWRLRDRIEGLVDTTQAEVPPPNSPPPAHVNPTRPNPNTRTVD